MELQDLLFEKHNGVGIITLNRPEKLNALSPGISQGIPKVMADIHDDPEVRVIVLTGAGRAFCAGGDVPNIPVGDRATRTAAPGRRPHPEKGHHAAFRDSDRPVIGAINGYAVGYGFGLALSCDIRIASEEAKFGVFQTRRGLSPDGGLTFLLPRAVGIQKALELAFTGDLIDAQEALRLGIVLRVVPSDRLMAETLELAERIARGPTLALAMAKRMLYKSMGYDQLEAAVEMELFSVYRLFQTEDAVEGVKAFLERREAVFHGR